MTKIEKALQNAKHRKLQLVNQMDYTKERLLEVQTYIDDLEELIASKDSLYDENMVNPMPPSTLGNTTTATK